MFKFIKREKVSFILIFSVISAIFTYLGLIPLNKQLSNARDQYMHLKQANYNYVYKTDKKMTTNSFIDFGATQIFYTDFQFKNRINTSSIMSLDVDYNDESFVTERNLFQGTTVKLEANEVLITKMTSLVNKLKINDYLYTKNKVTSNVETYTIKGIINNVFNLDDYKFNDYQGILVFGYNQAIENNFSMDYINFAKEEPSGNIIDIGANLAFLKHKDVMIKPLKRIIFAYTSIYSLIAFSIIFLSLHALIRDSSSNFKRLKILGGRRILINMIITRFSIYLLASILSYSLISFLGNITLKVSFLPHIYILFIATIIVATIGIVIYATETERRWLNMEHLIKASKLNISVKKNRKPIVSNLDFAIKSGDFVLLKGRNGSGKSTILKAIFREDIKKYRITGHLTYNGLDVSKLKGKRLDKFRREIGYVNQHDDYSGHYNMTVEDIIIDSINSFSGIKISIDVIEKIIETFHFKDSESEESFSLKSNPSKLSGGQQRILSILANIISRPNAPLYIIDEPLNNLDTNNIQIIVDLLKTAHEKFLESTFIIVTHNEAFDFFTKTIEI